VMDYLYELEISPAAWLASHAKILIAPRLCPRSCLEVNDTETRCGTVGITCPLTPANTERNVAKKLSHQGSRSHTSSFGRPGRVNPNEHMEGSKKNDLTYITTHQRK
jgi:hypothetical protein